MATEILTEHLDAKTEVAKKHADWSAINTRFGSERTLMAAVRTSLSLIGFGFTIYKVFESFRQSMGDAGPVRVNSPRRLGMTLVSLGVFVLVAGAWQHWLFLRELKRETDQAFPWSISLTVSVLMALTGVVVFVTILVRL
jgi:putative membrane protein